MVAVVVLVEMNSERVEAVGILDGELVDIVLLDNLPCRNKHALEDLHNLLEVAGKPAHLIASEGVHNEIGILPTSFNACRGVHVAKEDRRLADVGPIPPECKGRTIGSNGGLGLTTEAPVLNVLITVILLTPAVAEGHRGDGHSGNRDAPATNANIGVWGVSGREGSTSSLEEKTRGAVHCREGKKT